MKVLKNERVYILPDLSFPYFSSTFDYIFLITLRKIGCFIGVIADFYRLIVFNFNSKQDIH